MVCVPAEIIGDQIGEKHQDETNILMVSMDLDTPLLILKEAGELCNTTDLKVL